MIFEFIQVCESEECTNQENQKFKKVINSIRNLKIFIKSYIPNPLNINEPTQSQVLTFTLTKSHKGTTLYFKNVKITTDSSLIPYLVGPKTKEFLQYDYSQDEYEETITDTYYLNFALSYKKTYLDRTYDKLDSSLANFLAVFNALEIGGKILTFFFASFSKEFFMFNFILRNRLYIKNNSTLLKNKRYLNVSNPPKITDRNNMIIINSKPSKSTPQLDSNSYDDESNYNQDNYLYINSKLKPKKSIKSELKNIIEHTQRNINEKMIINQTSESMDKKNDNNYTEDKIDLNLMKNFWCNVLMSIDSDKSKYKDIENALKKIKLIQDLFDTSIYINTIIDIIRLKKILFSEKQLILFENICLTCDELQNYMKKIAENKEQLTSHEIKKIIFKMENEKQNKLTENIIKVVKTQLDDLN